MIKAKEKCYRYHWISARLIDIDTLRVPSVTSHFFRLFHTPIVARVWNRVISVSIYARVNEEIHKDGRGFSLFL